MSRIKINCDMGEGCATDAEVMPFLDCANVSCGAHAGSQAEIINTLRLAKKHGVTVGAHPGYADPDNFGRTSLDLTDAELYQSIESQLLFFKELCTAEGIDIDYIKPHGALNHDMIKSEAVLTVLCQVATKHFANIALMIPTGEHQARTLAILKQYNLAVIWEVFADRAYENNGLLRSRKLDGAVHDNPQKIIDQYRQIRDNASITCYDGSTKLDVAIASSVCIHGDNLPSTVAVKLFND